MIAECGKCQIRHRLELSAVKGRKAKFRCKRCGHVTTVATSEYVRSTIMGKGSQENALESLNETSSESENSAPPETAIPIVQPTISGMSIRTKITLVIVTLIVFSLSTVGFIASNRGSKALSKQAVDHLGLISDQKAKEYNNIFSRLQNEIESVALYASGTFARNDIRQNLDFRLLMPWNGTSYGGAGIATAHMSEVLALQRVGVSLRGLVKKNPYLELGYMATENNIMVLDNEDVVGIIEAEKSYIPTRRPWYIDAVKSKGTVWTQPYIDVNTKKLVVTCATPVNRLDNSIVGVVGFDVLLDTIQKDIISLDIGYDSRAFLLDREGNLLAKPRKGNVAWNQTVKTDNALESTNREFTAIIRDMMAGSRGVGMHTEQGTKVYIAYSPLPAIDASVGIAVSQNEVMKPAIEIRKLIISVWVVVVCISIAIGLMIGNGITRPINNLTTRADMISQGMVDLEEISNTRRDEIGVLIEAFNRLVTSLQIAISRSRKN